MCGVPDIQVISNLRCAILKDVYSQVVSDFVTAWHTELAATCANISKAAAVVFHVIERVGHDCSTSVLGDVLKIAQSKPAKDLYAAHKMLENSRDGPDGFIDVTSSEGSFVKFQDGVDLEQDTTRQVIAVFTAVQALLRPLKRGESRVDLALKARKMADGRGWKLPPNLDLLLSNAEGRGTATV